MSSLQSRLLILSGFIVTAFGTYVRQFSVHGPHAIHLSDFRLGILAGVGLALLLLGVLGMWRTHHGRRTRTQ